MRHFLLEINKHACKNCKGTGTVVSGTVVNAINVWTQGDEVCPKCSGTGRKQKRSMKFVELSGKKSQG